MSNRKRYWYCVTMDDLYKKDELSSIVTLHYHRDVMELLPIGRVRFLTIDEKKRFDGIGRFEVDLDFDYMKIDFDYAGYEQELSKDLQRAHNLLFDKLKRLPTEPELKAEIEKNLYNWYSSHNNMFKG